MQYELVVLRADVNLMNVQYFPCETGNCDNTHAHIIILKALVGTA